MDDVTQQLLDKIPKKLQSWDADQARCLQTKGQSVCDAAQQAFAAGDCIQAALRYEGLLSECVRHGDDYSEGLVLYNLSAVYSYCTGALELGKGLERAEQAIAFFACRHDLLRELRVREWYGIMLLREGDTQDADGAVTSFGRSKDLLRQFGDLLSPEWPADLDPAANPAQKSAALDPAADPAQESVAQAPADLEQTGRTKLKDFLKYEDALLDDLLKHANALNTAFLQKRMKDEHEAERVRTQQAARAGASEQKQAEPSQKQQADSTARGQRDAGKQGKEAAPGKRTQFRPEQIVRLPYYGPAAAGSPSEDPLASDDEVGFSELMVNDKPYYLVLTFPVDDKARPRAISDGGIGIGLRSGEHYFYYAVHGDSMTDMGIHDGDYLLVIEEPNWTSGICMVILIFSESRSVSIVVKRIRFGTTRKHFEYLILESARAGWPRRAAIKDTATDEDIDELRETFGQDEQGVDNFYRVGKYIIKGPVIAVFRRAEDI
jgi:SOS-response transcriptional repressor LexA